MKVFDVKLSTQTAGPSPYDNKRTEIFLLGCKKAIQGDPCPGCFNGITWSINKAEIDQDPYELAKDLNKYAPNKYITIGGGEPTDQIDELIILCKELKEKYNFHIMMYTWRSVTEILKGYTTKDMSNNNNKYPIDYKKFKELMDYVDIIVDGEYNPNERLYEYESKDGFYSSIGSGNQKIWNTNKNDDLDYMYMRDLKGIKLDTNDRLIYIKR